MRATYRTWQLVGPEHIQMQIIDAAKLHASLNACNTSIGIGIDGSSTNTGVAIMSDLGGLLGTISLARNSNRKTETPVEYKLALKAELAQLLINCRQNIKYVWYEEPFIGFVDSSSVLMMIRSTVQEILVEHKDLLGHIKYTEVNNKRWKKIFLEAHGTYLPAGGSAAEKAAIAAVLKPRLVRDNLLDPTCDVTQDEFDAAGIVFAGFRSISDGIKLESSKAVHKFKFETAFELFGLGIDEVEEDIVQSLDYAIKQYKIPRKVVENGITFKVLNGRKLFDNIVYETMGDDDKLLILIYSADKYANVLMSYCTQQSIIDQLQSGTDQTMVCYVWRKNRH